jgi:hypothetical protein
MFPFTTRTFRFAPSPSGLRLRRSAAAAIDFSSSSRRPCVVSLSLIGRASPAADAAAAGTPPIACGQHARGSVRLRVVIHGKEDRILPYSATGARRQPDASRQTRHGVTHLLELRVTYGKTLCSARRF